MYEYKLIHTQAQNLMWHYSATSAIIIIAFIIIIIIIIIIIKYPLNWTKLNWIIGPLFCSLGSVAGIVTKLWPG
jgi:TRAP-type mannitol/chloroaromatic compound transport system permease large subunit